MNLLTFTQLTFGLASAATFLNDQGHCATDNGIFEVTMDIFAGDTGYYHFGEECGLMPTLAIVEGVNYTLQQFDATNWYHPIGLAYGPDGALSMNDELELGVVPPGSVAVEENSCDSDNTCQSPNYVLNGADLRSDPDDTGDFGLDEYEGNYFSGGRDDFLDAGEFAVEVTITDAITTEFFYFCHIHIGMTGRAVVYSDADTPKVTESPTEIPYEYDFNVDGGISEFDTGCGTFNVSQFTDTCSQTFLCSDNEPIASPSSVDECFSAINCAMHEEMRVNVNTDSIVTFVNQMIPHHRNAVNMAKIVLKEYPDSLQLPTGYGDAGELETMVWEIINGQNAQITLMQNWLRDNEQPTHDWCTWEDEDMAADSASTTSFGAMAMAGLVAVQQMLN